MNDMMKSRYIDSPCGNKSNVKVIPTYLENGSKGFVKNVILSNIGYNITKK